MEQEEIPRERASPFSSDSKSFTFQDLDLDYICI